ncbi:hypothetical protein, partial [Paenibacillus sp. Marseille-Q4541]|uniref:hypothetical protein n=1 Tax=Paenibacillus sp. Marseille-Q4541 TaxID=2831522 RepID=UPI001BA5A44B
MQGNVGRVALRVRMDVPIVVSFSFPLSVLTPITSWKRKIRTLRFFTSIPLPSPDCRQKPLRTLILAGAGERRQSSASCADGCSD